MRERRTRRKLGGVLRRKTSWCGEEKMRFFSKNKKELGRKTGGVFFREKNRRLGEWFLREKHRGLAELWVCWFKEEKILGAKTEHEWERERKTESWVRVAWEKNRELGKGILRAKTEKKEKLLEGEPSLDKNHGGRALTRLEIFALEELPGKVSMNFTFSHFHDILPHFFVDS